MDDEMLEKEGAIVRDDEVRVQSNREVLRNASTRLDAARRRALKKEKRRRTRIVTRCEQRGEKKTYQEELPDRWNGGERAES